MKKKILLASLFALVVPVFFAHAQTAFTILSVISDITRYVIPLLITFGVIYFIWGVIQYVTAADEEKKTKARSTMISGIIGLFVIISIWGLVYLVQRTFGLQGQNSIQGTDIPCVPDATNGC